ncbi:MAG: hypothetical protein ACREPQ_13960 [Rhodanobacter sp.]
MIERPGHLVLAYHGCDAAVRDMLLESPDQTLKLSVNPYDWLGKGAYFFEDDWMRALAFAVTAHDHPEKKYTARPIHDPVVVGAVLRIHRWLDMGTREGIHAYMTAHDDLVAKGTKIKVNKPADPEDVEMLLRPMDRQILNHVHAMREADGAPAYNAVRSHFPQGASLLETSGFRADTHIQIALRHPECVVGFFRVREAEIDIP